jgi:hypothetical protein
METETKPQRDNNTIKPKSNVILHESDSEEEDYTYSETRAEEVTRLVNDEVPLLPQPEVPLSDQSNSNNARYLRYKKPDKQEIQEDPLVEPTVAYLPPGTRLKEEEDKSLFTKSLEYLLGRKGAENKQESKKLDDDEIGQSNTRETRQNANKLYESMFTVDERNSMSNTNNESTEIRREEYILSPSGILSNESYSATVKKIDIAIKVATIQCEQLAEKVGVNIEKSEQLVTAWDGIKKRLENHIKSLEGVNWKKALTYTAVTMAVIGFVYQCGIAGKLPNFAANVFSNIPLPTFNPSNVPKPKLEEASTLELINKIMERPVTFSPLNTVTGMGVLFGVIMVIKVLKLIRKVK